VHRFVWCVLVLAMFRLPAFAQVQPGSTGGSIGKTEKSISGGEEADRPRVATHSKQRERDQAVVRAGHGKEVKRPSSETTQTNSSTAPTCSKIRDGCLKKSSRFGPLAAHLSAHCTPDFAKCMQTGIWNSAYSHFEGVIRR